MSQEQQLLYDMHADLANTVYESIDQRKEEGFWEVIEAAIIKALGVMTGRYTLGEYGSMDKEDLEILDEIRYVSKYMGRRLQGVDGLETMDEFEAKVVILTSYLEGRRELDVGKN